MDIVPRLSFEQLAGGRRSGRSYAGFLSDCIFVGYAARPEDTLSEIKLHLGDCLPFMRAMESESIDAVVTDPPYGIGFLYARGRELCNNPQEYWKWYQPIHHECLRLLRPGGFWAVWQSGTYHRY